MVTSIRRQGEWTIVQISGRIELEKTHAFREACFKSLKNEKVVFVLDRLQFVGSTGMTEFFECLHDVERMKGCGVKLVGLSSDFKRFVAFTKASQLKLHETLEEAFKPALDPSHHFTVTAQELATQEAIQGTVTPSVQTQNALGVIETEILEESVEVLQSFDSKNN